MSEKCGDESSGCHRTLQTPAQNRVMFDGIARRYDRLNSILSLGRVRQWRRKAVDRLRVAAGGCYVDAGCGTGDLCLEIVRRFPPGQLRVTGIDHSSAMLAEGRRKVTARSAEGTVLLVQGDATDLSFADSSVDGVISGFVIRNITDRGRALAEWQRVIRAGGRCVVLELGEPETALLRFGYRMVTQFLVPSIGALFARRQPYRYLVDSIRAFPPPAIFTEMLEAVGFKEVEIEDLALGAVRIYSATK